MQIKSCFIIGMEDTGRREMDNNLFGGNICEGNHMERAVREHVSSAAGTPGAFWVIFYHYDENIEVTVAKICNRRQSSQ